MKATYCIALVCFFTSVFGQANSKRLFDIYTIDFLKTGTSVHKVQDESVSVSADNGKRQYSHRGSFLHNSTIEFKLGRVLDSLTQTAKIPDTAISVFSFYHNSKFGFADSFFYLKDSNTFISIDNKKSIGIDNLITFRYGSAAKYSEMLNQRAFLVANYKMDDASAKAFLQKDYTIYQELYPAQLEKAVRLLTEDIDQIISLNGHEKGMIVEKINERLKKNRNLACNSGYAVAISGVDVTAALAEVLDEDRLLAYLKYDRLNKKLKSHIKDRFYWKYKKEKQGDDLAFNDYLRAIVSK